MDNRLTAVLYDAAGAAQGEVALDPALFGVEPNVSVMHQVVTAQLAAARSGTASTKTRAEVRGGGRKPWRQKGTGRARHGSSRSPEFRAGGVAFGPKPRDYSQRTPKKMKRLALISALSARAAGSQVKVVEAFDWEDAKTRLARNLLDAVDAGKSLIVMLPEDVKPRLAFRNLRDVLVTEPEQLTTYDVLWADSILFSRKALESLTGGAVVARHDEGGGDE